VIEQVLHQCDARTNSGHPMSVGYLLYAIADNVVDSYFPLIDEIGDRAETISERIIDKPKPDYLEDLFAIKRALAEMARVTGQQRDMFHIFTRDDSHYISEEVMRYYMRDVYDHLLRISDMISTYRDTVGGSIDLYLSAVSNRLNVVVQRLTVITIGTGALAVITGFYGMNFERTWPPFNASWGVPFVLALMILALSAVLYVLGRLE
jgi:magnesium transporter